MATEAELRQALLIAADAVQIADSWNICEMQVHPPKEWGLEAEEEDVEDGWCSTGGLARKLRELAKEGNDA